MQRFFNGIVFSLASGLLKILKGTLICSLKIEALKIYIKAVGVARAFNIRMLTAISALLLGAMAFAMVHVGVLIMLPVSLEAKGLLVLILGIVYGFIAYSVLKDMCSEKAWLDMSGASEMLNDVLKKEDQE